MAVTVVAQKASLAKASSKPRVVAAKAAPKAQLKPLTQEKIVAGVTAASGAMLASPLAAQAAVTPSLRNLLYSVVAGGTVLVVLFGAVSLVAQFDPVSRK